MSCDENKQNPPSGSERAKHKPFPQCYRSPHSSRSSLFNESAAEIILGLFQADSDAIAHMGPSHYEEDDPSVRKALILQHTQNPNLWVRKKLARPELWKDNELEASN